LIPSELFGHEKGAFTGAISRRIGRFELADKGTLFLDEIGDIAFDIQVRLLRVLQTKEFERVGSTETLSSDFRLISAANRNLEHEVRNKRFRADLYYRINVFPIHVPPLRERKEDIPLLAYHFLKIYAKKMGKVLNGISQEDMDRLVQYHWPGNVRELENIIERCSILSNDRTLQILELSDDSSTLGPNRGEITLKESEARHIKAALERTNWKVRGPGGAAELLDVHPSTLAFRMKKLGIQRPAKR
jgi:transcriptional regulator with GAF, ATPase, and Fis domain